MAAEMSARMCEMKQIKAAEANERLSQVIIGSRIKTFLPRPKGGTVRIRLLTPHKEKQSLCGGEIRKHYKTI